MQETVGTETVQHKKWKAYYNKSGDHVCVE